MALKRLPNDVQSILCASAQVHNYKKAIEELIYNSLDAVATSIAIRIRIPESTIQVIDNGHGITKHDFNALGQRHMTSKFTDISTLKAAPKWYGHRGEFLANIVTISQMVKITSRHEGTEETWAKTFCNGKEKKFAKMTTRPTKGTTVDIKGFLYNLNIQKRAIDPINELQNIKSFLEQLSLVHNNISLSLRDDSKNEIVFKIHKKRDIYQTLSSLFDIDKSDVLELQVEKHEYKVKGLIKKADKDINIHWIYLNGRFIHGYTKLHKTIDEYFKKTLSIKDQRYFKTKYYNDEHQLFNQSIPFYFIFIICPYIDYNVNDTSKQLIIEFKNWEQIHKLLEKLVKFYIGDVNLKEIKNKENIIVNKEQINMKSNQDTRDEVKKIMDKILGNHSKKLGISQLQNGVKGKLIKRKNKKKSKLSENVANKKILRNPNYNKTRIDEKEDSLIKSKTSEPLIEHNIEQQIDKAINLRKEPVNFDTFHRVEKQIKISDSKEYTVKETRKQEKKRILKSKVALLATKPHKKSNKQKHNKKQTIKNKEFKYLKNTDSIYKKSKAVAKKAEKFLQYHTKKSKAKVQAIMENEENKYNKNIVLRKLYDKAIDNNLSRVPKINKYLIDQYTIKKFKANTYKTTYDLVKTVFSQQEALNADQHNTQEKIAFDNRRRNSMHCIPNIPIPHKYIRSEYTKTDTIQQMVQCPTNAPTYQNTFQYDDNFSEYTNSHFQKEISDLLSDIPDTSDFLYNQFSNNPNIYLGQKESSYQSGPLRILTFNSHKYHTNEAFLRNDNSHYCAINKRQNVRFITKQSRDNFVTTNNFKTGFNKSIKSKSNKQAKTFDIRMRQNIEESVYTIEYSESSGNNYNVEHNDILANNVNFFYDKKRSKSQTNLNYFEDMIPMQINDRKTILESTYTIQSTNIPLCINMTSQNLTQKRQHFKSDELFNTYSIHYSNSEINQNTITKTSSVDHDRNNVNIVFVSKSQCSENETPIDNDMIIDPLNVCETVFRKSGTYEREFALSFNEHKRLNDSLYGVCNHIDEDVIQTNQNNYDNAENISHHFSNVVKSKNPLEVETIFEEDHEQNLMPVDNIHDNKIQPVETEDGGIVVENVNSNIGCNDFNLKNRPRFLPKGMSQIFENCRSKTTCDYNLDKDYYEDIIYNNFANDVQVNSEVYEPGIQNIKDLTTKNIHKFQNKVKKDNASLIFDETSLKEVKVLGQVDCKFIATTMKKRSSEEESIEYLILFDQHAVHERIRLEENLADYIKEERWKSITIDDIILKISKDEILYLHNYKDKFTQLGLQWTILNDNEVIVNAIPEAILGKNPREVEKVIKAVRNLVVEEINVIKLQKGCFSLYPKSIMDLVFNEACRYAIKFGDQLSKNDCIDLLKSLSNCKTPFQCAHGRPVMAVIMDIKTDKRDYKINMSQLRQFKQRHEKSIRGIIIS